MVDIADTWADEAEVRVVEVSSPSVTVDDDNINDRTTDADPMESGDANEATERYIHINAARAIIGVIRR